MRKRKGKQKGKKKKGEKERKERRKGIKRNRICREKGREMEKGEKVQIGGRCSSRFFIF